MKGFYVPNSISSSYVGSKRNDAGTRGYEAMADEVGVQKQAAFQELNKQYASTIENAYASYLAANRGVMGSGMGQGYKEAYMQANQQNMLAEVANANLTAANARVELNTQEAQAQQQIQKQFEQEVSYFDRVASTANDYLSYLKTLTGQDGSTTYLAPENYDKTVDDLYDVIFGAQPQGYLDAEGNKGLTYLQWVNENLKNNDTDNAWAQWLFGRGGYQEFIQATKNRKK